MLCPYKILTNIAVLSCSRRYSDLAPREVEPPNSRSQVQPGNEKLYFISLA